MRDHQNHGYAPASRGKQCHRAQNDCGIWNLNSSHLGGNLIFFSSSLNNLENILLLLNFVMFLICFAFLVFPLIRRILLPTDNCFSTQYRYLGIKTIEGAEENYTSGIRETSFIILFFFNVAANRK